jgi:hypothetical protein
MLREETSFSSRRGSRKLPRQLLLARDAKAKTVGLEAIAAAGM